MKNLCKKRLGSFLMALVLLISLMPMAEARSRAELTYSVDAGETVTLRARDFREIFRSDRYTSGELDYIVFTGYRHLDDYGHLSADGRKSSQDLDESSLKNVWFHYDSRDIASNVDCDLNTLTFTANRRAPDGTLVLDVTLVGQDEQETVDAKVEIVVGRGSSSGSHSSKAELTYSVDAGETVKLRARDFREIFRSDRHTSGELNYIVFIGYRHLDDYGHLSADGRKSSQDLDESSLKNVWFHYDSRDIASNVDCDLNTLTFTANRRAPDGTLVLDVTLVGQNERETVDAKVEIVVGRGSSSGSHTGKADLTYSVDAGETVNLRARDFREIFRSDRHTSGELNYIVFTGYRHLDDYGHLSADGRKSSQDLDESSLKNVWFHYDSRDIANNVDCDLNTLTFTANRRAPDGTLVLDVTLVGQNERETVDAKVEIVVGRGSSSGSHGNNVRGDIEYTVEPGGEVLFNVRDFTNFSSSVRYVEFLSSEGLSRSSGDVYYRYNYRDEEKFTPSSLENYKFYVGKSSYGDYPLDEMSFVADRNFDGVVVLKFRAWKSSRTSEDGTLVIRSTKFSGEGHGNISLPTTADIRYCVTDKDIVRINANDIARFYSKKVPGSTLQSVILNGIPAQGALYYNFYGTSPYGSGQKVLSAADIRSQAFSYSPTDSTAYALSELLYVPYGTNYCTLIPFTAYGTDGRSAAGCIYISVSKKVVPEVYGQTLKGQTVTFPAAPVHSAVSNATGSALSGIRLLSLPAANVGKITLGSTALAADTTTVYGYSGSWKMSDLRFIPASGYTGAVEIPYAAYDASGNAYAVGRVCVSVLNKKAQTFKDMTSKTWCYKYVTELSDAHIIDGYADKTFKEKNTLTYGAALKLVMLGAGYPEQAPTVKNSPFSGYLAKAKADGLVRGNVNLKKSITRGEVSQLAAKALKLNTKNLSSVQPFTDTKDPYIQALNEAGIIEGYFANGTSTFKPNNSLTRGHISAIVWRMIQYRK